VSCSLVSPLTGFPLPSVAEISTGTKRTRGVLGAEVATLVGFEGRLFGAAPTGWDVALPPPLACGVPVCIPKESVEKQNNARMVARYAEVVFVARHIKISTSFSTSHNPRAGIVQHVSWNSMTKWVLSCQVTCHPYTRCAAAPGFHVSPSTAFRAGFSRTSVSSSWESSPSPSDPAQVIWTADRSAPKETTRSCRSGNYK